MSSRAESQGHWIKLNRLWAFAVLGSYKSYSLTLSLTQFPYLYHKTLGGCKKSAPWAWYCLFVAVLRSTRNFPHQGWNLCPLQWKCGVLTTGPPGKSNIAFLETSRCHRYFVLKITIYKHSTWTSLVAQRLRIRLPMQGTRVRALVQEDPTCCRATKPVCHNYWALMPQLLKPAHLEPVLCDKRSHHNEKPTHRNKE